MSISKIVERVNFHCKCRNSVYPRSNVNRFPVPDEKVSWDIAWPEYEPVQYNSPAIHDRPWADPSLNDPLFRPIWNALDNTVNRKSHFTEYKVVNGLPLNPIGRTGITGRGVLGRWGPNHAADPILTRWKRNSERVIERDKTTQQQILQFVGIERKDCKEWAIPGGMVDPGETVSATLKREFLEEAMNYLFADPDEKIKRKKLIDDFFKNGELIYKGYVDDPRNTDNAWMETVVTNFHDEDGNIANQLTLIAGDDAGKVKWIDIRSDLKLYASHLSFLGKVANLRNSHW